MRDSIISWYSGHRGEEYPLVFLHRGEEKRVEKVLEMRVIEDRTTAERRREFTVLTEDRIQYHILVNGEIVIEETVI
jgi:hypothetical protein